MTRFLDKTFSVHAGTGKTYRDNWDRIFSKDKEKAESVSEPSPETSDCTCLATVGDDYQCPVHRTEPFQ